MRGPRPRSASCGPPRLPGPRAGSRDLRRHPDGHTSEPPPKGRGFGVFRGSSSDPGPHPRRGTAPALPARVRQSGPLLAPRPFTGGRGTSRPRYGHVPGRMVGGGVCGWKRGGLSSRSAECRPSSSARTAGVGIGPAVEVVAAVAACAGVAASAPLRERRRPVRADAWFRRGCAAGPSRPRSGARRRRTDRSARAARSPPACTGEPAAGGCTTAAGSSSGRGQGSSSGRAGPWRPGRPGDTSASRGLILAQRLSRLAADASVAVSSRRTGC